MSDRHEEFRTNLFRCAQDLEGSTNELSRLWGMVLHEVGVGVAIELSIRGDSRESDEQLVISTIKAIPELQRAIGSLIGFVSHYEHAGDTLIREMVREKEAKTS